MSATLFLAAALMAQAPTTLTVPAPTIEGGDVGYHEIMAGRPRAAIERIERSDLVRKQDPLALINLGTAYKLIGEKDRAATLYRNAASSDERYDVQLSDGRWVDSRRAASLAMNRLSTNEVLALR
ncbi:MAG: hypothetical protein ACO1OX_06440 [Novosphingobium sp.]